MTVKELKAHLEKLHDSLEVIVFIEEGSKYGTVKTVTAEDDGRGDDIALLAGVEIDPYPE